MSLFRQLWLAVIGLTLTLLIGSLWLNIDSARRYLEQQLTLKNLDNANALALTLSQLPQRDAVTVELAIAAQFDTGHYAAIRLTDPNQHLLVERRSPPSSGEAPTWFVRLFPLHAAAGVAQVQDGWRQLGTLTVVSDPRFAYRELWRGALKQAGWFATAALLAGLLGTLLLRIIVRPLGEVVGQARAIADRQLVTLDEPRTPELRDVVQAMNALVTRLKQIFAEQAERLEAFHHAAHHDPLTGLPNRSWFLRRFEAALQGDEAAAHGTLFLLRVTDPGALNRRIGHAATDALLRELATTLSTACAGHEGALVGRLNGADFALVLPDATEAEEEALLAALDELAARSASQLPDAIHIGTVAYARGQPAGAWLAAADQALAQAEASGARLARASAAGHGALSAEAWRELIATAAGHGRLSLARFPVQLFGEPLALSDSALRLGTNDGRTLVAGEFLPMAARLNLIQQLDLAAVELGFAALAGNADQLMLNLSTQAVNDWSFHKRLAWLLDAHSGLCPRLWFEVSEYGATRHRDAFADLARALRRRGCRVGIEHCGHRLDQLDDLAAWGLDYVKVDASFVGGVAHNAQNQEFLRGLARMAHALGILVIAEGVSQAPDLHWLRENGLDGATGPAVPARA